MVAGIAVGGCLALPGPSQGPARPRHGRAAEVVCMAHPRRIAKVAKQIEREVGGLLMYDRVVQEAVCPQRLRGSDGALSALASVTEVQISNDLQVAKVYLSVYSDDAGKAAAVAGLQRLEGYVRGHIGRAMRLRLTPEIRFVMDESIERSERVLKLLERVRMIEAGEAEPPPVAIAEDCESAVQQRDEDGGGDEDLGAVDLGFFEGGDEEGELRAVVSERSGGGGGRVQGGAGRGSKDGSAEMGADEVEEMMALFRQESAAGVGRGRRPGAGRRGGGVARPRRK